MRCSVSFEALGADWRDLSEVVRERYRQSSRAATMSADHRHQRENQSISHNPHKVFRTSRSYLWLQACVPADGWLVEYDIHSELHSRLLKESTRSRRGKAGLMGMLMPAFRLHDFSDQLDKFMVQSIVKERLFLGRVMPGEYVASALCCRHI